MSRLQIPTLGRGVFAGAAPPSFPLSVSADARYLVSTPSGKPFFLNAESAWNLITQASTSDLTTYFADRRSRGVTAVNCQLIGKMQDGTPVAHGAAGTPAPFTSAGDFSTPNSTYFTWARSVVDLAATYGIVCIMAPCYSGYPSASPAQGWQSEIAANSLGNCTGYGTYVAGVFASAPNVIWMAGGDNYDSSLFSRINAVMQAIKTALPSSLRTSHWQRDSLSTDILGVNAAYDWANLNAVYDGLNLSAAKAGSAYAVSPTMPAFGVEFRYYDNNFTSPNRKDVREDSYVAWLQGCTCGTVSGREKVWEFGSSFPLSVTAPDNWQAQLGNANDSQLLPQAQLVAGRAWHLLVPDTGAGFITSGRGTQGTTGYVACGRTPDGTLAILYAASGNFGTIDLTQMAGSGAVTARYFDPTTGVYYAATGSPLAQASHAFNGASEHGNNSDGFSDLVLVLET